MSTNNHLNFSQQKLPNGLRVVLSPLKQTQAVTLLIILPVGSRYESRSTNGVSHFIEHLFFKGTTKRPQTADIARELDSVGAEYNAYTGKDHTGYYVKLSADKIELAFDMLSDMLFNSLFDPREIERERGVIVEEINMYEDNPLMNINDLFEEVLYPNSTLGWNIAGPREVIRSVTPALIKTYRERFYATNQMVLGLSGNFDSAEVRRLLKKYFSTTKRVATQKYAAFKDHQAKPQLKVRYKDTEQVQVCLGFPAYHYNDKRNTSVSVLSSILGGNMSSRLFIEVRERRGLAYFVKTGASIYRDVGNFYVQAGLDQKRVLEALEVIIEQLGRVKREGISDQELETGREFIKGKLILELENSESVADWFTKQAVFKKQILTPAQMLKKIDTITKEQVQAVAVDLFHKKKLNLAVIGPYKNDQAFKSLLVKTTL